MEMSMNKIDTFFGKRLGKNGQVSPKFEAAASNAARAWSVFWDRGKYPQSMHSFDFFF